jgi:phage host-nuclease inhibitor protein Gam
MATRLKSKAATTAVPQTKPEVAEAIRQLGDKQRAFERMKTELNDRLAAITQEFAPHLTVLAEAVTAQQQAIQTWCEAHRVDLCGVDDKLGKTANLVTGEVGWRMRPPSVKVRDAEGVIDTLIRMDMRQFVRTKEEVNKEAILADPERVRGIAGITIVRGAEDFFVVPFEAQAEVAAMAGAAA